MPRFVAAGLALLMIAFPAGAAQPQFWEIDEAAAFLEGDLQGLSVDTFGRVRLAPAAPVLDNPSCPYVWSLARDARGVIYAGTGNDGKVFRIAAGDTKVFFDTAELEVHALAVGRDGTVYAATSPDGKVYAIDAKGEGKAFFDPEERYIWALAFDAQGRLIVATGDQGKVYRVAADGTPETLLDGPESHITALAVDKDRVYAGSSPSGVVYRIDPGDKKAFVLADTLFREIKALEVGAGGALYAAAVEGSDKEDTSRPAPAAPTAPPAAPVTAEVTVTESFLGIVTPQAPAASGGARTVESPRTGQTKGALLKISPAGELDTLWSSTEEMPYAMVPAAGGAVLMGTGNKGKLYRITDDRSWTMMTALPVQQITALAAGGDGSVTIGTSNPGTLYGLGATAGEQGTFVSKVRDTETVSSWGRLQWQAETPAGAEVRLETRSGNTATPDKTWSDWSPARAEGGPIQSERARFLQMRAVLSGKKGATPVLESIRAAYLQRNLRPQLTSVTVHPPGEVFQKPLSVSPEAEILGLDPALSAADHAAPTPTPMMPLSIYSRKLYQKGLQTFSWKGDDPNGDALVYDIEYRPIRETRFRPLRSGLADTVLAWDTSTVPNGRYVVRIIARDTPSNPDALALSGDKESTPFDVDNTPPAVTASAADGRIRASARDDSSLIRRAEFSIDGSRWEEIHPQDGINDSLEETYEFTPKGLGSGSHIVVVRATDLLGNVSTARVTIP
jgi:outer membrane protein assembly factor BamB